MNTNKPVPRSTKGKKKQEYIRPYLYIYGKKDIRRYELLKRALQAEGSNVSEWFIKMTYQKVKEVLDSIHI